MKSPQTWVIIGEIARPHGIKGYVKVRMHTDYPHRFQDLTTVYLWRDGQEPRLSGFKLIMEQQDHLICQIPGVETRSDAAALRGTLIVVPRAQAVEPPPGEYYIFDLVGLSVYSEDGEHLGELKEVLQPGANDVYVVEPADAGEEILLPAIADVILDIDLETGRMLVRLLPGMLEQ
ncbi:MAG: 16S rRNA processing protein RimM [Firmicutes bacterium]|nr:16S rRNA processing protein RimM [Bacillota bacterium]